MPVARWSASSTSAVVTFGSLSPPLVEEGLEENLRSSFQQDYPEFEVVFAIRRADDPSVPVARRVP